MLENSLIVDHDQRAVLLDDFPLGSEVQRHDRDLLEIDVLPDVQFGPVGEREHTDRLALLHLAVVEVPQFRTLVLRIPAVLAVTEGVDTLLGPGLLFVATGTTEGGIEAVLVQCLLEPFGLHDVGVLGTAIREGVHVLRHTLGVDVGDQLKAHLLDHLGAKAVHLLELPARVDMQHRERQLAREKGLARQVQHYGRIFADGIQHHRVAELCSDLTNDMDAFRLQLFQMRQFVDHGYSRFADGRPAGRGMGATLTRPQILIRKPLRPKSYRFISTRRRVAKPQKCWVHHPLHSQGKLHAGFGQSINSCLMPKRLARYSPSACTP